MTGRSSGPASGAIDSAAADVAGLLGSRAWEAMEGWSMRPCRRRCSDTRIKISCLEPLYSFSYSCLSRSS